MRVAPSTTPVSARKSKPLQFAGIFQQDPKLGKSSQHIGYYKDQYGIKRNVWVDGQEKRELDVRYKDFLAYREYLKDLLDRAKQMFQVSDAEDARQREKARKAAEGTTDFFAVMEEMENPTQWMARIKDAYNALIR